MLLSKPQRQQFTQAQQRKLANVATVAQRRQRNAGRRQQQQQQQRAVVAGSAAASKKKANPNTAQYYIQQPTAQVRVRHRYGLV